MDITEVLALIPNTLSAMVISVHPTYTPIVLFIGIAKHSFPAAQTVMTKLPWGSQLPTLPDIQAIWLGLHGDEKFSFENRLLYACAWARLELY